MPAITLLTTYAKALTTLAEALQTDPALERALTLMAQTTAKGGRIIVTGVGKSGHIGGKIAATLASTGTPSFFVHPTEALHGDLGMITGADCLLALSHSGESKELSAVLEYATRFRIPLIAITGKPESTLGRSATAVLNTRVEREACPLNLAPTTSTSVSLALADALAVTLMERRGFSKEEFARFHPGGKLGAQLLRVHEVMVAEKLPLLTEEASMSEVLVTLTRANMGCVGFTNKKGNLTGIFTDGDLKRRLTPTLLTETAHSVMTPNPRTIGPEPLATAAAAQMDAQNVTSLWVVEGEKPVGLIRVQDLLHRGIV